MALLYPCYVTVWNTKKPGKRIGGSYADYYLLNSNRIIELRARGVNDSSFYYAEDPDDARDSPGYIECGASVDQLRLARDAEPTSKFITLPMFPTTERVGATTNTTIEWKDIAYVYVSRAEYFDSVCHVVYYEKAWGRRDVVVNLDIIQLWWLQYV